MALVVEDGTGLPDANSYVSVADCKAYLDARGKTSWGLLTLSAQEASLINATDYLDSKYGPDLGGARGFTTQALMWPRNYIPFDGEYLPLAPLPMQLIRACCEAAFIASTVDLTAPVDRGGRIIDKLEIVGPITERTKWADGAPGTTSYPAIDRWMNALTGMSSTVIGSAVRG